MKPRFFPVLLLLISQFAFAQDRLQYTRSFENGTRLYKSSQWQNAASSFRQAQESADNRNEWAQALYWVILSELAYADYGSAIRDMDELEKNAFNTEFSKDMIYHRARVYFNQGFFEDAMVLFGRYSNSIPENDQEGAYRKASGFFWIGECLYTMGQYDEAEKFYSYLIAKYPGSPKVEISSYRMDLIKQKKIEAELLALLRWSHEESLRTSEDYQRKIKTYEYTLNAYQRRLAEQENYNNSGDHLREKAIQLENEVQVILNNIDDGTSDEVPFGGSR